MAPSVSIAGQNGSSASKGSTRTQESTRIHASSTAESLRLEDAHAAHNYHPLPIVFSKASGALVWDPEGKEYIDFLSAYSAVNQGHCHPKIVGALVDQAQRLTLSSRAFHNDVFPVFSEYVTKYFGYDRVLPMNTGAEAVETAIKIARKWGYKTKKIPTNEALVVSVAENFHGRTFSAVSMSTDETARENYGPYLPGVGPVHPDTGELIKFNDADAVEALFKVHGTKIAAFLVEPIQGEAGIVVPDDEYLPRIRKLCTEHNILLICDEIQTGIARTGKLLCQDNWGVKADMILLGKAISGGVYPVSAVLTSDAIMGVVEPGTHGSTYGGNPLGCAVAIASLKVVVEENLVAEAERKGKLLRKGLEELQASTPGLTTVRGKGLLNAVIVDESKLGGKTAWQLCLLLKEKGVLAKPTHENIIRLAPPLVITDAQLEKAVKAFGEALNELPTWTEQGISEEEKHYVPVPDT